MTQAPKTKPRVLSDFEGKWQFSRIVRHASGDLAEVTGQAVWTPQAGGLQCREAGQMVLNGAAPVSALQEFFWQEDLCVYFKDGRFFHQIPAMGGDAAHWCEPDQYDVTYDFAGWPCWSATWRVKGPRKDYTLETRFSRP